ncbi:hypothetical protein M5689_020665 [Euphorbia peplus]|nr:hypothetical protein M5689_020665 [Euphorbia peplus]
MKKWQKTHTTRTNALIPAPERRIQDLVDELAKMKVNEGEMEVKIREVVKRVFEEVMRGKQNEDARMPQEDAEDVKTTHKIEEGTTQGNPDPVALLDSALYDNDVVYNCDFMFQTMYSLQNTMQ